MQIPWINYLSNWNPQLLRECRGRLNPRTIVAAVALSAIAQVILLLIFLQNIYLTPQEKWLYLWRSISWTLPYVLFTVGSYYLVSDLTQEQKQDTFNFIRLSPRPAWEILLGKLLGVPVLLYLTLGLTIPLHFVAAFQVGISLSLMLSFYVLLVAGCVLCYSTAMLCGLLGNAQLRLVERQSTTALVFAAFAFLLVSPLFMFWNVSVTWQPFNDVSEVFGSSISLSWFYVPLTDQIWLSHGFTLANLSLSTYIIWRMLLRHFCQPRSTGISKRQSYAILAYLEVLALGFLLQPNLSPAGSNFGVLAAMIYGFTFVLLLSLMFGVCPQRQALLDWTQYQSQNWQSLIWVDKSPALLAIFIHLAIANALLLPWSLVAGVGTQQPLETVIAFVVVSNMLLIYGTFIQLVFAAKIRNRVAWAVGGLGAWWIVPPTLLGLLRLFPDWIPGMTVVWTFLGYPFWHFTTPENLRFALLGIISQWLFLAFLLWRFQQTLQRLRAGNQS